MEKSFVVVLVTRAYHKVVVVAENRLALVTIIHLFKIRGAKTEVFCCLRFCIFEANISFCVQSFV